MARHTLDAKGLQCPLPVLRARKMLKGLGLGDLLAVEATDPSAPKDFAAFCEATGNRLVSSTQEAGVYLIDIEKRV